jgi:hypothetical protein
MSCGESEASRIKIDEACRSATPQQCVILAANASIADLRISARAPCS